ncbi:MAG: class 1 fructose-bisphosphatase [Candidatus Kerfeldbacteria bacterium]|nr:class 1 fructose-bisphosphatase [Candidatus Kerfeldbacteria bacterium]
MVPNTLHRFLVDQERKYPEATGELSELIQDIALAGKLIAKEVSKAGIGDILGSAEKINVQGEDVQKLDVFSNVVFIAALEHGGHLSAMASEENEELISIPDTYPKGKYIVAFDPLDGSKNIDVSVSVGSIFSIRKRREGSTDPKSDFLRPGTEQVAAGYIVYGSNTMLVYTTGQGVHGFTLDPSIGEYILSHPDMTFPETCTYYSVNHSRYTQWDSGTRTFVDWLRDESGASSVQVNALMADLHRNILKGGVHLYPSTTEKPKGKLRVLYELHPLAMVVEQAGGMAVSGTTRMLDVAPHELHERAPIVMGNKNIVEKYLSCIS